MVQHPRWFSFSFLNKKFDQGPHEELIISRIIRQFPLWRQKRSANKPGCKRVTDLKRTATLKCLCLDEEMVAILSHRALTVQRQTWKWGDKPKLLHMDRTAGPRKLGRGFLCAQRTVCLSTAAITTQTTRQRRFLGGLGAGRSWMGLNLGATRATQRASESEVRERRPHSTELALSPPVAETHTHTQLLVVANGSLVTCSHRVGTSDALRHGLAKGRVSRNKNISLKTHRSDRLKACTVISAESAY